MKYIYFISLILIVSTFTSLAHAQFTGGGEQEREPNEPREITEKQSSLLQYGVLKLGFSNPSGIYGRKPRSDDTLQEIFNSEAGFGAERSFSVGVYGVSSFGISYRNLFEYNIDTEIGYLYGINYSQNEINWGNYLSFYDTVSFQPFHYIDVKLGPIIAISPYPNLVFDLFYNAMFTLSIPSEMEFQFNISGSSFYDELYVDESDYPYGIRHGIGFNVRYARLLFSIERTWGSLDTVYTFIITGDSRVVEHEIDSVMDNSVTLVTLGILF